MFSVLACLTAVSNGVSHCVQGGSMPGKATRGFSSGGVKQKKLLKPAVAAFQMDDDDDL